MRGSSKVVLRAAPAALQLKLANWPSIDHAAWERAVEDGDILSADNRAALWAAGTRCSVIKAYGRWLAWLMQVDRLDGCHEPVARVTPEQVSAYVTYLQVTLGSVSVWGYVHGLGMALSAIAPETDLPWLWQIARRLSRRTSPTRRKRHRIVPVSELRAAGMRMMDEAESAEVSGVPEVAARYRNGLMIALLAARPIRLRNVQSISIGTQLSRRGRRFHLHFPAGETKTNRELHLILPADLSSRLDTYLARWRPVLLSQRNPSEAWPEGDKGESALWISVFGRSMSNGGIYERVSETTRKEFGHHINPHLFRDCAATSIALEDPEHVRIVTSILGHACLTTSERYYNHALSQKAASLHQADVVAMRKQSRKATKGHRRGKP